MAKLPKTDLNMSEIVAAVGINSYSLKDCFNASNLSYFDPAYSTRTSKTAQPMHMGEFRNYGPSLLNCGVSLTDNGGGQGDPAKDYLYAEYDINVTSNTGSLYIGFNPSSTPDRLIATLGGAKVLDTGYRSNQEDVINYNNKNIEESYKAIGKPRNSIYDYVLMLPMDNLFNVRKTSSANDLNIKIYTPLDITGWRLIVECPVQDAAYSAGKAAYSASHFYTVNLKSGSLSSIQSKAPSARANWSLTYYLQNKSTGAFTYLYGNPNYSSYQLPIWEGDSSSLSAYYLWVCAIDKYGFNYELRATL